MNPVQTLQNYGQSVWLDYIRRSLITSGEPGWLRGVGEKGVDTGLLRRQPGFLTKAQKIGV